MARASRARRVECVDQASTADHPQGFAASFALRTPDHFEPLGLEGLNRVRWHLHANHDLRGFDAGLKELENGRRNIAAGRTEGGDRLAVADRRDLAPEDALIEHVHAVHDDRLEHVLASNHGGHAHAEHSRGLRAGEQPGRLRVRLALPT